MAIAQAVLGDEWLERCRYWLQQHEAAIPKRKRRERQAAALVLTGFGVSLRVQRGALVVKDGNTHYPASARVHTFFKGGLDKPPRIVIADGSGEITLDALDWMTDQGVDLIRLRADGAIASLATASGYAAAPDQTDWQDAVRGDPAQRAAFASKLIREKLEGCLENLEARLPASPARDKAIAAHRAGVEALRAGVGSVDQVFAIEGKAAAAYFYAWRALPIRWKATGQHPIPEDWRAFTSRSSLRARDDSITNRYATHPVNALLNYAYGMLEARTRMAIIAEGYDPTRGILHGGPKQNRDTYVFDLMEPQRPSAERVVLDLLAEHSLHPADFQVNRHGHCRVGPELARVVSGQARPSVGHLSRLKLAAD